ncbi:MAG: hypothetical protein QXP70_03760 [Methanomassiliicoccales archaeon]
MASLYSLVPHIPTYIFPYVGAIALIAGLLLAFFGDEVWKIITSLVGALLGASLGYSYGASFGLIAALLVAFIGAVLGGFLFYYIAEAGISLLIAYFAFLGVLFLLGASPSGLSTIDRTLNGDEIVAIVIALAVFIVCIIFFSDIIAVITSVAGGLLVDYGLTSFHLGLTATAAAIVVIVAGMSYQFVKLRRKKATVHQETANTTRPEELKA